MKKLILCSTVFLLLAGSTVFAQKKSCKVLLEDIKGTYEGECLKGYAHGFGKSVGTNTYEGDFKKGLPHGKGTYTMEDGTFYVGEFKDGAMHGKIKVYNAEGGDPIKYARWRNGEYEQDIMAEEYQIIRQWKTRVTPKKVNEEKDFVRIQIKRKGNSIVEDLQIYSSSGTLFDSNQYNITIDEPVFPLTLKVRFVYLEDFKADAELILESSGNWMVTFDY